MDRPTTNPASLLDQVEALARTQAELYTLQAADVTATVLSKMLCKIILAVLFSIIFFIASIGLALWLGVIMGGAHLGFFSVAGIWAIIALGVYLFRSAWIKRPVRRSVLSFFTR